MNTHNQNALFKLSYGLYVLTAREGDKDNGCIINVAPQLTDTPLQMLVSVNKQNYTHDMIARTGLFNVSLLTEHTPMTVIQHFGFVEAIIGGSSRTEFRYCGNILCIVVLILRQINRIVRHLRCIGI